MDFVASGCPSWPEKQKSLSRPPAWADGRCRLEPQQAQICLEYGEFLRQTGCREEAIHRCEEALAIRRRLGIDGVAEAEAAVARARSAVMSKE